MSRLVAAFVPVLFLAPGGVAAGAGATDVSRLNGALAQARTCKPLCARDRNPCDPIVFKLADGRCKVTRD